MKIFEQLPTRSVAQVWNNDYSFGICISFSETDFGFGEITFAVIKETGQVKFDDEEMSLERCGRILERTIGTKVEPL